MIVVHQEVYTSPITSPLYPLYTPSLYTLSLYPLYHLRLLQPYYHQGGQIHIQKATTQEILLSYIFTLHNHDLTSAQAILEVFRTASEIGSAEFIIIDDASTEPMTITNRMINTLRAKFDTRIIIIHHNTSAGYTMSNNEGLRTATGTYAVLINSDLVVLPSWIALLFRTLFTFPGKVGMVGPLQISSSRKVQERYTHTHIHTHTLQHTIHTIHTIQATLTIQQCRST